MREREGERERERVLECERNAIHLTSERFVYGMWTRRQDREREGRDGEEESEIVGVAGSGAWQNRRGKNVGEQREERWYEYDRLRKNVVNIYKERLKMMTERFISLS